MLVVSRRLRPGSKRVIEKGPVRTITESVLIHKGSRIIIQTIGHRSWPVIEYRLRVDWREERRMLKLAVPTVFDRGKLLCEVPGGAIRRPGDGEEHVFGRWAIVGEGINGRQYSLAAICTGPHGLDFKDGELRISALRSAAYCHERGFRLAESPARKFMDQGIHELRFLITAGEAGLVRRSVSALADWLATPPFAIAHLPFGRLSGEEDERGQGDKPAAAQKEHIYEQDALGLSFLSLDPISIRLTACKRSDDGKALVVRLHEAAGFPTEARLTLPQPPRVIQLSFRPFEIKTLRIERTGAWREAGLISET